MEAKIESIARLASIELSWDHCARVFIPEQFSLSINRFQFVFLYIFHTVKMKINASIRHQTLSCFCGKNFLVVAQVHPYWFSFRFLANLIVMSRGSAAGFFSANFLAFQRQDTPLPSGPLTLGEATLVLSIVHIGAIIGNLIFPMFVRRFGCKRTLLVLGYPQIVIETWNDEVEDKNVNLILISFAVFLDSDDKCTECLLLLYRPLIGRFHHSRVSCIGADVRSGGGTW